MKVHRIKHKPTGRYITDTLYERTSRIGKVFTKKSPAFKDFENNPDYEILWDDIKD